MNCIDTDTYLSTLNFMISGRRQNLCWLMSHCNIDRPDAWRDAQFANIQAELDALVTELELAKESFGERGA